MPVFMPTQMFRSVASITPEYLKEHGIRALILDVDNTLTGHGSQELPEHVEKWLNEMKQAGILLAIASNNFEKRVAPFAKAIGVEHVSFCCKPASWGLARARKKMGVSKKEVALVGDQVFTDAVGANFYGIPVLLCKPMYRDIKPSIRLKRVLERPLLARYRKKGGNIL